jgi:molybdopterin synthase catalytic subunit
MGVLITIRVQPEDFDVAAEIERAKQAPGVGAVVSFTGVCRSEGGRLSALELEHYPGMAEEEITRIAEDAARRWPLAAVTVIHRHGRIAVRDNIVLVIAASSHRHAAFEAAGYLMDYLKTRAPFWKKEHLSTGGEGGWVAPNPHDEEVSEDAADPRPPAHS